MYDAALMSDRQGFGHAPGQYQRLLKAQSTSTQSLGQILSGQPLHGQIGTAAVHVSMRDVAHDAGMLKLR